MSVVAVTAGAGAGTNLLPVHNHKTGVQAGAAQGIGACVKPLHFTYNKSLELVQFIELNRMLGVTHFTLYNDTVSQEVDCLLHHYQAKGLVQVLPWKLDLSSQKEIRH